MKPNPEDIPPEQLFEELFKVVQELGWNIAIPESNRSNSENEVPGLIIGSSKYIEDILSGKYVSSKAPNTNKLTKEGNEEEGKQPKDQSVE